MQIGRFTIAPVFTFGATDLRFFAHGGNDSFVSLRPCFASFRSGSVRMRHASSLPKCESGRALGPAASCAPCRRIQRRQLPVSASGMFTAASGMSTTAAPAWRCSMGLRAPATRRRYMGCAGTRSSAMGDRRVRMDSTSATSANAAAAHSRTASGMSAIRHGARSAVIVSSTLAAETMAAPTVAIAPSSPWAHAQEDAVVEVSWPVEAHGRAGVRGIAVVAV